MEPVDILELLNVFSCSVNHGLSNDVLHHPVAALEMCFLMIVDYAPRA